ncbi:MAG: ribbon-helix-helix protein, CopG family [Pseudomonadota bacterium]|nr:ribbon-helix-helix protein, CopG family [Pseudomonadota bacterium]
MKATTIRMEEMMLARVDSMAKNINRSRTWLINQAVERFLNYEEWFIQEVRAELDEVANGETATPEEVVKGFAS